MHLGGVFNRAFEMKKAVRDARYIFSSLIRSDVYIIRMTSNGLPLIMPRIREILKGWYPENPLVRCSGYFYQVRALPSLTTANSEALCA